MIQYFLNVLLFSTELGIDEDLNPMSFEEIDLAYTKIKASSTRSQGSSK